MRRYYSEHARTRTKGLPSIYPPSLRHNVMKRRKFGAPKKKTGPRNVPRDLLHLKAALVDELALLPVRDLELEVAALAEIHPDAAEPTAPVPLGFPDLPEMPTHTGTPEFSDFADLPDLPELAELPPLEEEPAAGAGSG